jgi:hypothetical protein
MISITPFRFEKNNIIIEPELLVYSDFKAVYDLDKNTNKELALKYFIYIYHSADQKAVPVIKGYSIKELHNYACREAGLPITFKPDSTISRAIIFYKENFISPVKELQLNLLNTLQKNIKILSKVDDMVDKKLNIDELTPEQLTMLMEVQSKVSKMAKELTGDIKTMKDLDILINNSKDTVQHRRGGDEIENSMIRNDDIEN